MNEPESDPPELTPAQEDAVRRHLAAARHTEPMPDAVAERLDRVLVGLAAERAPAPEVPPVIDLAARRRRRRGVQLLVAAAAVVVAGVGISQLPGRGSNDSGGDAASSDQGNNAMEGPAERSDKPGAASSPTVPELTHGDGALSGLPVIRPGHFRADVAEPGKLIDATASDTYELARKARAACPVAAKGERTLLVTYSGALAKLVYEAPTDDGQRVDLYRCGDGDGTFGFVRSVLLPSP